MGILLAAFVLGVAEGSGRAAAGLPPCALTAPATLHNTNSRATSTPVPPGASSVVLCLYHGPNAGRNTRRLEAAAVLVQQGGVAPFTDELQALSPMPAAIHCPIDNGVAILAVFRYPAMADDPVRIGLSGCLAVGNGHVVRAAASKAGAARLIRQLTDILEPKLTARRCADSQLRHADRRLADWSNWCGSRTGVTLVVRVGRSAPTRATSATLPACLGSGGHSRLVAVH